MIGIILKTMTDGGMALTSSVIKSLSCRIKVGEYKPQA